RSFVARVDIHVDVDGPRLDAVEAGTERRTLTLHWNDHLTAAAVVDLEHYSIDGARPIAAFLFQDTNVVLTTAEELTTCVPHVLTVRGLISNSGSVQFPDPLTNWFQVPLTLVENSPAQLWRYSDEGVDLGTAWRAREYDDAAWRSGPGP